MGIAAAIAYVIIYFAGKYGAVLLNMLLRRVLVTRLRLAGFGAMVAVGALVTVLIEQIEGASAYDKGVLFGSYVLAPILFVTIGVAISVWLERRRKASPLTGAPKKLY